MKKTLLGLFLIALAFGLSASSSAAFGRKPNPEKIAKSCNLSGENFVDKNKDGVCDLMQSKEKIKERQERRDERRQGSGENFVDKNKDGVCDNEGTGSTCSKFLTKEMKGNGEKNGRKWMFWRYWNQQTGALASGAIAQNGPIAPVSGTVNTSWKFWKSWNLFKSTKTGDVASTGEVEEVEEVEETEND